MANRRQWRLSNRLSNHLPALSVLASALLLVSCGGGGSDPVASKVVSFGDSLSDLGAYSPATSLAGTGAAPFFGGRFTTNTHTGYTAASNSNTATVWVEWVAAKAGLAITPHEAGFAGRSVKCPVEASIPSLAYSCTGYGMGGSRVTDPNGIGKTGGALTVPMVTQVANHLTRFTAFDANDIVFVFGGNNDTFIQFGAVAAGLPPPTALGQMQNPATELVALVKDQILAKGAKRVVVMTLPDGATSPGFSPLPAESKGLLSQLSASFNTTLTTGLAGADVRIIDTRAIFTDVIANPSKYGFVNATTAACDPAKIQAITGGRVTDGSSLFCNSTAGQAFNGLKAGASDSTWAFADSVHPTKGGHKVLGDQVILKLKEYGWIPSNL